MNGKTLIAIIIVCLVIACTPTKETIYVVEVDERNERIDSRDKEEAEDIIRMIQPYKEQLDASMNKVIGHTEIELIKQRPNGSLNNWAADALLLVAQDNYDGKVDFAIQNYGGVRVSSIARGDITVRNIFEMMPFDNVVSILKVKGSVVRELMERIVEDRGWPISRNVQLYVRDDKLYEIKVDGESVKDQQEYTLALPDYIANGNSGCGFLSNGERNDLDLMIRDGIIQYLQNHSEGIPATLEKRIYNE